MLMACAVSAQMVQDVPIRGGPPDVDRHERAAAVTAAETCLDAEAVSIGATPFVTPGGPSFQRVRSGGPGVSASVFGPKWYAFTPAQTGFYDISLCGSVGDTVAAIAPRCPDGPDDPLPSIAYNDDACPCASGCTGAYSSRLNSKSSGLPLVMPLQAGTTYRIVIGGFSALTGPTSGTLVIDLADGEAQISLRGPRERGDTRCFRSLDAITYEVWIDAMPIPAASAQMAVRMPRSEFVSISGVPGKTEIFWSSIDTPGRTAAWLVSTLPGLSRDGLSGPVALLTVEVNGENCATAEQVRLDDSVIPIVIASGDGRAVRPELLNPRPVVVDGRGPRFVDLPGDVTITATGTGPCQGVLQLVPPTAVDACSGLSPVTWKRSDGRPDLLRWPCGPTTVTWTATDACGRGTVRRSVVTVR